MHNLEQQLADEMAALDVLRTRRGEALAAGRHDEAANISREIGAKRDGIEALHDAIEVAREHAADAEQAAVDREAAQQLKALHAAAREVRKLAKAHDDAIDGAIATDFALRAGMERLWHTATGPQRANELECQPAITGILPAIVNERLAYGGVLRSQSANGVDREKPARSVATELEVILAFAPGPGRPPKSGEPKQEAA